MHVVVLGKPGHLSVVEIVVPWRPARGPEVHHEWGWVVQEVHVFGALCLAHQLVVHVPGDRLGGPLDRVSEPVGAWVEASGVGVVLRTILGDDVHRERILSDGGHQLDVDLVPAVRPVLSSVSEERLDGTHLAWVLHLCDKFAVGEPLLGAHLTREVVGLGN